MWNRHIWWEIIVIIYDLRVYVQMLVTAAIVFRYAVIADVVLIIIHNHTRDVW